MNDGTRLPDNDLEVRPHAPLSETHPFYWSVRREMWENRSIVVVPVIVMGFALFGSMVNVLTLLRRIESADMAARSNIAISGTSMAPAPVMFITLIVALFYSIDALYGERRDRSVLFWKSQPVSDRTTVAAKAAIPLVVLPLIGLFLGWLTHFVVVVMTTVVLAASDLGAGVLWADLPFLQQPFVMAYGMGAHALWYAPIYGWLLLVSAWAKRVPFLWAVLPFVVISAVEWMAFGTSHFGESLQYRFGGAMDEAFRNSAFEAPLMRFEHLDPIGFLTSGGLWSGLVFTAVFLVITVRLRRHREPI